MNKKTNELGKMGVAWEKNAFYDNLIELYDVYFSYWEKERGIKDNEFRKFMGRTVSGQSFELVLEDVEKFQSYWGIRKEDGFLKEYGGFIRIKYYQNLCEFGTSFNKRKCEDQVNKGQEKAIELLSKRVEGYKLIRLFDAKVDQTIYQEMNDEVDIIGMEIVDDKINKKLEQIVFEEIQNQVARKRKKNQCDEK